MFVCFVNIIINQLSFTCTRMTETDKPIIGQLGLHVCIQVGNDCLPILIDQKIFTVITQVFKCPRVLGIEN